MLLKLENEGFLVKGYFLKDDETLYWMSNESLKILENGNLDFTFNERFIISPQDQLSTYLAPMVRDKFGFSSCFIIFHGLEPSGVFIAKQKKKHVKVLDFKGEEDKKKK